MTVPRYVILEHDWPHLHWDLMLESGDHLRTWRLAAEPAPGLVVAALALPEHRRLYLDYEGPLSGNRGTVQRRDAGEYQLLDDTPDEVAFEIQGSRLQGRASMRRQRTGDWTFRLE